MPKITWQLLSDEKLIIDDRSVDATILDDKLVYEDQYGKHIISKKYKTYQRIGKEDEMFVDFNNNIVRFTFDNKKLDFDIISNFTVDKNKTKLSYNLGDEEKTIIITEEK